MAQVLPGGNNTFIPSHEASKRMIVDYVRNPKAFAYADYIQIVKCPQRVGYYLKMNNDEAGRVLDDQGDEYLWNDGADAPSGRDGTAEHEWEPFITARRAFPFTLGQLAVDQASWKIDDVHRAYMAQKAMTVRTMNAVKVLTTAGNHLSSHVLDVTDGTDIPGNTNTWATSTSARKTIQRSINQGIEKCLDDTLASLNFDDFVLIISDSLAKEIAVCQEIVEYLRQSPFALAQIKGELRDSNPNAEYGLPEKLYSVRLVVEKTRRRTNKRRATRVTTRVMPAATPVLAARPGTIEGSYGGPALSAVTCFAYEEMTTETKRDKDNRRITGRVVEDYIHIMTAPESCVLFQNAL
jgi:hypothetical protein